MVGLISLSFDDFISAFSQQFHGSLHDDLLLIQWEIGLNTGHFSAWPTDLVDNFWLFQIMSLVCFAIFDKFEQFLVMSSNLLETLQLGNITSSHHH
jgi:hypothetical protein